MAPDQESIPPWFVAGLIFLALDFALAVLLHFRAERVEDGGKDLGQERRR